ncbi:MAG TPA: cytochrome c5 family protein [Gammaproteobacteria bacterium]|nr:cytochrome c5 family protein [Gammaproteobacteria bacterium]
MLFMIVVAAGSLVSGVAWAADGEAVFQSTCKNCHATGVMGAPKFGSQADWGSRIAQGMAVLYQHALNGFTGKKGMMPARGGRGSLSDEEVKAAVDYMVNAAK